MIKKKIVVVLAISEYHFREILRFENEKCEKRKLLWFLAISDYHFREILRFGNEKCEKKENCSEKIVW